MILLFGPLFHIPSFSLFLSLSPSLLARNLSLSPLLSNKIGQPYFSAQGLKKVSKGVRLPSKDAAALTHSGKLGLVYVCTTDGAGAGSAGGFYEALGVKGDGRLLSMWVMAEEGGKVKVREGGSTATLQGARFL